MGGGENKFLGGSDPTLCGLAAAQRLAAPGVATAQVFPNAFFAPSPAELQATHPTRSKESS
jgi:hypothetical protein